MAQICKITAGIQSMINAKLKEFVSRISEIAIDACKETCMMMQRAEQEDLNSIAERIDDFEKQLIKLQEDANELKESIAKQPFISMHVFINRLNGRGQFLQTHLQKEIDRIAKRSQTNKEKLAEEVKAILNANFV